MMDKACIEYIVENGLNNPKGAQNVPIEDLINILDEIKHQNICVHAMEVSTVDDMGLETPEIEFSIIGADGDLNWENHCNADRSFELLDNKIKKIIKHNKKTIANIWLIKKSH